MWQYYLMSCAGFFRSRQGLLWQLVLTRRLRKQMYRSVRWRYRPLLPSEKFRSDQEPGRNSRAFTELSIDIYYE